MVTNNTTRLWRTVAVVGMSLTALMDCGGRQPLGTESNETTSGMSEVTIASEVTERPPSFLGRWIGVGEQRPSSVEGQTWSMEVEIRSTAPGECGAISYPSLNCRGVWICEPGFDGVTLHAVERITEQTGHCVDGGVMEMALTEFGGLQWRQTVGEFVAWATLTRPR